jgi:CPA2 family monovalent cation:H+ antiporter-2
LEDVGLILDLVLALGVAALGGVVARRLGLPVFLGYVAAGVFIGPNTPGFTADFDRVHLLANVGAAFLMFALGVEFSLNELQRVRRVAFVAGGIQIPLTMVLGTLLGLAIDWSIEASLLLGGAFAISSSIVALKLLAGRGEAESPQARIALGVGVVQDLSLVPMLALLPLLTGEGDLLTGLLRSLLTAGVALALVVVLGVRVVPRVLYFVARLESRELFLLTIVLIALGTAFAAHEAGLSLALGAFLAGLVVSESEFDSQVLAEIIPIRDLFATLFFVALGMLIDPDVLWEKLPIIVLLVVALIVGKLVILGGAYLAAGVDHRTATLAALTMAQIGEFSFVLAGVGLSDGIIDRDQYGLIIEVALGSILISPLLAGLGPSFVAVAQHLPGVAAQEASQAGPEAVPDDKEDEGPPSRHVVICGYGRVGAVLGQALERRGLRYTVIELNPAIVRDLRRRGVRAYYGDAGSDALLLRAGIHQARSLAVTSNDLLTARTAVAHARRLNPSIDVVTRATAAAEIEALRRAGADEVVQPEFEAGLEFVRHVLRRQGVSAAETTALLARRRASFYDPAGPPPIHETQG